MPAGGSFREGGRDALVTLICAVVSFAVFCIDLATQADNVSVGFAYDLVVVLTALAPERRLYGSYAAVGTVLIGLGCFFPLPPADEAVVFFVNRLLAVMSLWLIAAVIHYRSKADVALVRALEASETASHAKSRFLASMSHELRAPLTGILGFSEILKSELLGPIGNARYLEYVGHIHESGEHMLSLINDVLDIAKIEAGRMEIEPEWIIVHSLFEHILDMSAGRAEAKSLTLTLEASPALNLFADVRAVKQMALNLLSNALKFTPEGGTITVAGALAADGGVTLSVRDTGVGLSYESVTRLMRPFEQVDNRFGAGQKGSGLGLSLVKGLIELHGGHLTIDSQVGHGSVFSLYFPPGPDRLADRPGDRRPDEADAASTTSAA